MIVYCMIILFAFHGLVWLCVVFYGIVLSVSRFCFVCKFLRVNRITAFCLSNNDERLICSISHSRFAAGGKVKKVKMSTIMCWYWKWSVVYFLRREIRHDILLKHAKSLMRISFFVPFCKIKRPWMHDNSQSLSTFLSIF